MILTKYNTLMSKVKSSHRKVFTEPYQNTEVTMWVEGVLKD